MFKDFFSLSDEQQAFVQTALSGKNILVDACIGSGKTTAIQHLCYEFPHDKSILYLTYNRLLKLDAQTRIRGKNITVTNYHGLAYSFLSQEGVSVGIADLIQAFNHKKVPLPHYDILLLDEYQDIEQELAEMLEYIKASNPEMQIIAVGDMQQKIYDKTTLNVPQFIDSFLGQHEKMTFTKCFRLSADHAAMLGRIWNKTIVGVNDGCKILTMKKEEVVEFLSAQSTADILCLGARGDVRGKNAMVSVLNELEEKYPFAFNKKTVYASIRNIDGGEAVRPTRRNAIFTTYDSSKGLERKICVVFDFTVSYWLNRVHKPTQSYEILRNIFCVAASRGKEYIIFVDGGEERLTEQVLREKPEEKREFCPFDISDMFDFKYKEDIEACYHLLKIHELPMEDKSHIQVKSRDALIDLSPCIGIFQEACFFKGYEIDRAIELYLKLHKKERQYTEKQKKWSLEKKILYLTALETGQDRYLKQVELPFIDKRTEKQIKRRLKKVFSPKERTQAMCLLDLSEGKKQPLRAEGLADVIKNNVVYELKFVSELMHEHFLQCACYVVASGLAKGILWNTRKNEMYEIEIPDGSQFKYAVAKAITKGTY